MPTKYAARNRDETERMAKLVGRLKDEELSQRLANNGWTVAGSLAHLAFWDQRALLLLRKWQKHGVGPSAVDIDVINDAAQVFLEALGPQTAARMAIEAAAAIDQEIESLSVEMLAKVESDGKTVRLDRAAHRRHHLAQIDALLAEERKSTAKKSAASH